jgi:hypothetical protein
LYSLTGLSRFQISNNTDLTGNISTAVGKLSNLTSLGASNTSLSGSIPESLFWLTKLQQLDLHMNDFTGGLSEFFANLTELGSVMLSDNSFRGVIPPGIAELSFLSTLLLFCWWVWQKCESPKKNTHRALFLRTHDFAGTLELHTNDLTGSVPEALCARRGDGWSDLKVLTVDLDEVTCTCCSNWSNMYILYSQQQKVGFSLRRGCWSIFRDD